MKIKRFFGKDMRSALTEVKEVLGPDAVIMSNKRVNGGVEIMAAFDQDLEPQLPGPGRRDNDQQAQHQPQSGRRASDRMAGQNQDPRLSQGNMDRDELADSLQALLARQQAEDTHTREPAADTREQANTREQDDQRDQAGRRFSERENAESEAAVHLQNSISRSAAYQPAASETTDAMLTQRLSSQDATIHAMKSDMSAIRELLETQVSGLVWQDLERREPTRILLIKKLTNLGFTDEVADQISCFVPEGLSEEEAWENTLDLLQAQIATTHNDILSQGGVVALVGPTGVGKTTTIAKLAARYAQIHGPDSVALVTTDTYRIAASEQLQTYARIIGCPIKVARDADELNAVLVQFRQRRLVLIDTAGMSQRDIRLSEQLATLMENSRLRIRPYLVLSATAQASVQNEIVRQFKRIPLSGCIFTKLDESLSLGEVLSTAIHNSLPISYLTDGQQVPEDIQIADARELVKRAAATDNAVEESRYSAAGKLAP